MLAANNGYLNVVKYLVEKTEAGDSFDEETLRRLAVEAQSIQMKAERKRKQRKINRTLHRQAATIMQVLLNLVRIKSVKSQRNSVKICIYISRK